MNPEPAAAAAPRRGWSALAFVALALALLLGGAAIGRGLERFRMADRVITVKGLAEQDVKADYAVWQVAFRRAGNEFAGVQQALAADRDRVLAFLKEQGLQDAEVEVRPLQVEDLLARDYVPSNQTLRFNGSGRVWVKSARVDVVGRTARATDPLIKAGVQLVADDGSAGPRYQLRALHAIKGPLLAEATRNAREQAARFATEAGAELGRLKNANQGVIQIFADAGDQADEALSPVKRLRVVSTFSYELR